MRTQITHVSKNISNYLNEREEKYLHEIKESLQKYFFADACCIFSCDANKSIQNIFQNEREKIVLNKGLIHEAVRASRSMIFDRVNSHKLYCSEVDNICDIKIKSMMIMPIGTDNKTVGVVVLYKDAKRKKLFNQEDLKNIEQFLAPLRRLTKGVESNGKNHSPHLPKIEKKQKPKVLKQHKNTTDKSVELELEIKTLKTALADAQNENRLLSDKLLKVEKQADEWEEKYLSLDGQYKFFIEKNSEESMQHKKEISKLRELQHMLKSENMLLKQNKPEQAIEKEYKTLVIKYDKFVDNYLKKEEETEELHKTYEALKIEHKQTLVDMEELNKMMVTLSEKSSIDTHGDIFTEEKNEISLLENKLEFYESKVEDLEDEKKRLEEKYTKNIALMSSLDSNTNEMQTLGQLLITLNLKFKNNEYAYMFLELILYAVDSTDSLRLVNDKLKNSKVIFEILEEYDIPESINNNKNTYLLSTLIENIESYKRKIFPTAVNLKIEKDKFIPNALVVDMPKVQSVIYYLLMDFSEFMDFNESILINIKYDHTHLFIDIAGKVVETKTTFGLYSKNPVKDISQRPVLQFARMILHTFGVDIEPVYKGRDYRFSFSMPYTLTNNS